MGNSDLGNSILFGPVSSHHSQTLLKAFAVIMRYLDSITKYVLPVSVVNLLSIV